MAGLIKYRRPSGPQVARKWTAIGSALVAIITSTGAAALAETEPAISHPEQMKEVAQKLTNLEKRTGNKPNILVLMVDDMGWGDPGAFGGGIVVGAPTPNIDRLARQGLKLTSTYAQPTCSPTRATLMTGRLPSRHGVTRPPLYGEKGGMTGEITAAQLLNDAGYHTALVGKWHLGEAEEQQPQNLGYDEFYGFLGVSTVYTDWRDEHHNPEVVNNPERFNMIKNSPFIKNKVKARKEQPLELLEEITIPVLANIDIDWMNYTVDLIKQMKGSDKPFYLLHNFSKPHFDNYPADGFKGASPAKQVYKDAIVEVDYIVGQIIKTLEETGQAENTLVFFASDNGVEEDSWPDSGYAPWRGSKGTTWEGGVRVPGIAWWPGMIQGGRESDGLFDLADLFNTSLALAGAEGDIPTDRYIDGIDQTSFLLTDNGESNRENIYYYMGVTGQFAAMRWQEYKWHSQIVNIGGGRYDAVGGMQLGTIEKPFAGRVYNLYTSPRERVPQLIRKLWVLPFMQKRIVRHLSTYRKYPPKRPVTPIN